MGSYTALDMTAVIWVSDETGSCGQEYWRRHDRKVSQRFMMVIWVDMLELVSTDPGNSLDEGSNRDSNVVQNISNWLTKSYILEINGQYRRAAFRKKILYAGWEVSILYAGRTQSMESQVRYSPSIIDWGYQKFCEVMNYSKKEIIER